MNRPEGDSYRPRYGADLGPPPPLPADAQAAMYHFQGNGNDNRPGGRPLHRSNRPPRPFKFRALPPSERPLFTQAHLQESSELTFGGDGAEDKFRNLDDLTDTDETDMEVSVDSNYEDSHDAEAPPSKRSRINEHGDAVEIQPKWSNPDPYTALPPVDQDSRKKTNVVHLIRKARNTAATGQKDATASHDDDFISFDFDDEAGASVSMAPHDAPLGPRLGRHDVVPSIPSSTLGKRTRDDFENAPLVTTKYGQQYHSDGRVLQIWKADTDCNATPWVKTTISSSDSAGVALHKEIIDFYEWVQPRDYEVAVRGNLLGRLEQALLRLHPGGKLEAFGSYAAGLYLPVGDMDLVYLDRKFNPNATSGGLPPKPTRRLFESTAKFIREQRIARPGSVNAIWFAKVPIIKFIENVSGLKVDLSFNNSTGVIANQTFQRWREVYPAMPIITSIIKQFLMIRGLNDVASGGLGGFSVICLVTSLLQHMPHTSQPSNLGQTLVEFFNLYGKLFNRQQVAIRLDPPGYLDVVCGDSYLNANFR
jgi:non-canonical poly(A) RNA polymerase PAPD5/7